MGDFLGFTFGDVHSSDLGITRVSGGDRYDEQLYPEIKDRAAEVPGVNGNYYFGSDFGPKTIDLEIAFDHLTEKQFRILRKTFGTKEIKELIFDERPYKKYMAKLESPVELSYICFNERIRVKYSEEHNIGTIDTQEGAISGEVLEELPDGVRMVDDGQGNRVREKVDPWVYKEGTERIYKGEGKMTFICYFPFAKSTFKVLPEAGQKYYEGSEEWAISSGILPANLYKNIDYYNVKTDLSVEPFSEYFNIVNIDTFKTAVENPGLYRFECLLNTYNYLVWECNGDLVELANYGIEYTGALYGGEVFVVNWQELNLINIYNAGDISTGFRLYIPFKEVDEVMLTQAIKLTYQQGGGQNLYQAILQLKEFEAKPCEYDNQGNPTKYDIGFLIDTNTGLITGVQPQTIAVGTIIYDPDTHELIEADQSIQETGITYDQDGNVSYTTTGNLYNEYVESGYFFKFEPDELYDGSEFDSNSKLMIENGVKGIEIFYDYLYF